MLLSNKWITEEIKEEIKKYLETNENESMTIQKSMGRGKSCSKREVYRYTILAQETRKITNKQPNLTPKATRERRINKTQS